jgi:hypothetical protein
MQLENVLSGLVHEINVPTCYNELNQKIIEQAVKKRQHVFVRTRRMPHVFSCVKQCSECGNEEMNSADYVGQTVWQHIIFWNDTPLSVVWVVLIMHSPLSVATITVRIICITRSLVPRYGIHPSRSLSTYVLVKTPKKRKVREDGKTKRRVSNEG